jgi:hypothetical protein
MIQFCTYLMNGIANPDFWKTVISFIACLVGIVSLRFVYVNVKTAQKALRAKIFIDVLTILEGKDNEVRDMRLALNEKVRLLPNYDAGHSEIKGDVDKFHALARSYDKIGLLVKHGAIPVEFLFEFYSAPILMAWKHTRGLVFKERAIRKQEGHMRLFETLAAGAAIHRNRRMGCAIPEDLTGRIHEWESWDTWNE